MNQFVELLFCGTHLKPHGTRGLSKHYNLRFDPKLGNGICVILRIPSACVACTSMLDQTWIYVISTMKKANYQTVTDFTYWPIMGSYINWNIILLSPK